MAGALSAYRVLEFGDHPAVAVLGMLLADQGADVVKVESPEGDPLRGSPVFSVWNRGKKSVVVAHDDWDLLGRLEAGADAVIEGSHSGQQPYGIDGDSARDACAQTSSVCRCRVLATTTRRRGHLERNC